MLFWYPSELMCVYMYNTPGLVGVTPTSMHAWYEVVLPSLSLCKMARSGNARLGTYEVEMNVLFDQNPLSRLLLK